jgi:DNA-binding XRE family transcriptional regulator
MIESTDGGCMAYATLTMDKQTFVLVPKREFDTFVRRKELPELPTPDSDGNVDALPFARAAMARKLIQRREGAGLTQQALADAAKVRIETVNRFENGKVTPDTKTIIKIDKALKRAEAKPRL